MNDKRLRARVDYGFVLATLLSVFTLQHLFRPGFPPSFDIAYHFYRVLALTHSWQHGVLYPRWVADLAFGHGYPLFSFYPPLLYYLAGLLSLTGVGIEVAVKICVGASLVGGALGMYLLAREWLGSRGALLASAAFTYAPFRLREISLEGDYAQLLGLTLVPALLWSLHRLLVVGKRRYLLSTALGYGALLLTHNISAFLATPLVVGYGLFLLYRLPCARRNLLSGLLGLSLGLGLAAFFWVPALAERHLVQLHLLTTYLPFADHFLALQGLFLPSIPLDRGLMVPLFRLNLGPVHILLAFPSLMLFRRARLRAIMLLAWLLLVLTTYLTLPYASLIWENVPLLPLLQFPWRFLGLAALPMAFLIGSALLVFPCRLQMPLIPIAVLAIVLSSLPLLYPNEPFVVYEGKSAAEMVTFELETGFIGTTTLGEYLPQGVDGRSLRDSPLVGLYLRDQPIDKLDRSSLPEEVVATTLEHRADGDRFYFVSPAPFTARLHTLDFPGWRAYLDRRPVAIRPLEGLISVEVPAGEHELLVRFESTLLRRASGAVSWASLVALGLTMLLWRPEPRDRKAPHTVKSVPISGRAALGMGTVLLTAFACKALYVDSHTFWFRRASLVEHPAGCEHLTDATFGQKIDLIGYSLDKEVPMLGDRVKITLCWQALEPVEGDWHVFMHLRPAQSSETVAQADVPHPGGIPTSIWRPGKFVQDEHILQIPSTARPGTYRIAVGLYRLPTWERLPLTEQAKEYVLIPHLRVVRSAPKRRSDAYTLGEDIELVDYRLEPEPVRPGQLLTMTLYWQARRDLDQDWTIFVHLVGPDGHRWGQRDGHAGGGGYPTSIWQPGEVVEDERYIAVPGQAPPGQYRLLVGMYDLATMARLPARGPSGPLAEDAIVLPVRVEPGRE